MIAIILARKNSKEIKNKNLTLIRNKPLIYWTILSCLKSKFIKETYVSSDSKKILKIAKSFGVKTIVRPTKISGDKSSSEAGWLHAIKEIEKNLDFETVIALQATSCLRSKKNLDKAILFYKKKKFDTLFSGNEIKSPFYWQKKNKKLISNYNFKKRKMRQETKSIILENGSFFIFKKNGFKKNKNRFFGKIGFFKDEYYTSFQIDSKDDLELLKILMNRNVYSKKINKKYLL